MFFLEILRRPTIGDVIFDPIWIAVAVGVLLGWAWKPKWAENLNAPNKESRIAFFHASSAPGLSLFKLQVPACISWVSDENDQSSPAPPSVSDVSSSKSQSSPVNEDDLRHLHRLVEEKDEGPAWIKMMERSTPNMSYQAWRRDPETGPPEYRSRTIYEDATPETLRDFFWDDEFRMKWDDMLLKAETLKECSTTGTMIVQWVRKFPFFCSDREYIIGRRIWDSGRTYYCITKGVPCSSVPRRYKPRRVDLYYSSWCIRSAESKRDGRLTACEVLLFHHEDMGIPWELAKLGVRQGMWGAVKKIDPGLRAYQKHRASGAPISPSVLMAQINSKFSADSLEYQENTSSISDSESLCSADKPLGRGIPKLLVVGGAIALAYTLDQGLLTKAVIFGVARKFANMGRKL